MGFLMPAFGIANERPRRIGIVGFYGVGNLGDEAVVAILLNKLRQHYPSAELVGFSLKPTDTERRHGIKALPIIGKRASRVASGHSSASRVAVRSRLFHKLKQLLKRWPSLFSALKAIKELSGRIARDLPFLCQSFHRLQGFDMLVIPGSGSLTDWWGGPTSHPYTFLMWSCLARLRRIKFIALGIGYERMNSRLGKHFSKWFLALAHYRSFRDHYSREAMKEVGLTLDDPVFPDQGFAVLDMLGSTPGAASLGQCQERQGRLIIGVSPVGQPSCVGDNPNDFYRRYIETLSLFVWELIQRGHRIAFCPTDCVQDPPFVEQIIANIK